MVPMSQSSFKLPHTHSAQGPTCRSAAVCRGPKGLREGEAKARGGRGTGPAIGGGVHHVGQGGPQWLTFASPQLAPTAPTPRSSLLSVQCSRSLFSVLAVRVFDEGIFAMRAPCALLLDYVPPEEPPSKCLGNALRIW